MMSPAQAVELREGLLYLLDTALPGRGDEPCGVLVFDRAANALGLRLRRDWRTIAEPEDAEVLELLASDLRRKSEEMGPGALLEWLSASLSNVLRIRDPERVVFRDLDSAVNRAYRQHVAATVEQGVTHIPLVSLRAAAGGFSELQQAEVLDWLEAPETVHVNDRFFAAIVEGHSMEPRIPSGSLCLFRHDVTGSRVGKLVLVENRRESSSGGERYTIKRYQSRKQVTEESFVHTRVWLEPLNPDYPILEMAEGEDCEVIAEFRGILETPEQI